MSPGVPISEVTRWHGTCTGNSSDPWIHCLLQLFREHPAWRQTARFIDRRATNNIFFAHWPGQARHLERLGNDTLLLPGAAPDPDCCGADTWDCCWQPDRAFGQ